jgi:hypothetical protein
VIVSVVVLLDDILVALVFFALPANSLEVRDQVRNFLVAVIFGLPLALKVQARVLAGLDRRLPVHYRGLVVSILLEELLHTISAEEQRVLLHGILILPVVVIYMLLIEVVILLGRDVGGDQLLIKEGLPGKGLKPGVCFDFGVSIQPQTV